MVHSREIRRVIESVFPHGVPEKARERQRQWWRERVLDVGLRLTNGEKCVLALLLATTCNVSGTAGWFPTWLAKHLEANYRSLYRICDRLVCKGLIRFADDPEERTVVEVVGYAQLWVEDEYAGSVRCAADDLPQPQPAGESMSRDTYSDSCSGSETPAPSSSGSNPAQRRSSGSETGDEEAESEPEGVCVAGPDPVRPTQPAGHPSVLFVKSLPPAEAEAARKTVLEREHEALRALIVRYSPTDLPIANRIYDLYHGEKQAASEGGRGAKGFHSDTAGREPAARTPGQFPSGRRNYVDHLEPRHREMWESVLPEERQRILRRALPLTKTEEKRDLILQLLVGNETNLSISVVEFVYHEAMQPQAVDLPEQPAGTPLEVPGAAAA